MSRDDLQYWEVWYPRADATGLLMARGQVDPVDSLILHAAPEVLTVEISDSQGRRIALGENLKRSHDTPMCRLTRQGETISRQDIWPGEDDIGSLVLFPGGEAGHLLAWQHADDHSEWRWQVEFYNQRS